MFELLDFINRIDFYAAANSYNFAHSKLFIEFSTPEQSSTAISITTKGFDNCCLLYSNFFMMNDINFSATDAALAKTEITNTANQENACAGKDEQKSKRHFGIVDMWSIRRNAKTFRIHSRMPRV